jgi:hypothetical protein
LGDRDGITFDRDRDGKRLNSAMERIFNFIQDGEWHTLEELAAVGQCSEACASARLRDCRKERFGGWQINRSHCGNGLWKYRFAGKAEKIA